MLPLVLISLLAGPVEPDAMLKRELETVSRRSIWFAHQSVGMNLIDGVREVAAAQGVPLRIVEGPPAPGTFAHAFIPENGNPALKLQGFSNAPLPSPGIALLKFCYVDFDASTDVKALFASYKATLSRLEERHPETVFVHVTTPLTTVQGGVKAWVKGLLGRTAGGVAENARREEYNALLRAEYAGREPVFDLARLDSTRPDGTRELTRWNGRDVPALVPAYTTDGGHLNEAGRVRIARRFVEFLAALPAARQ